MIQGRQECRKNHSTTSSEVGTRSQQVPGIWLREAKGRRWAEKRREAEKEIEEGMDANSHTPTLQGQEPKDK